MGALPEFDSGSRSPRALLEQSLAALASREDTVRAFVTLNVDEARAAADRSARRYARGTPLSPVDGCPVAVKDIMADDDVIAICDIDEFIDELTTRDEAGKLAATGVEDDE